MCMFVVYDSLCYQKILSLSLSLMFFICERSFLLKCCCDFPSEVVFNTISCHSCSSPRVSYVQYFEEMHNNKAVCC